MGWLILVRKKHEDIIIDHPDGPVVVRMMGLWCGGARLGVQAPASVRVDRREVHDRRAPPPRGRDAEPA